eukprot:3476904-Prymnesium_polylepis.1
MVTPCTNALASRELQRDFAPSERSWPCLCGRPAVPTTSPLSQCAYSNPLSPTPPAAACSKKRRPVRIRERSSATCTVDHVTGKVDASSNERLAGCGARSCRLVRATQAIGANARP